MNIPIEDRVIRHQIFKIKFTMATNGVLSGRVTNYNGSKKSTLSVAKNNGSTKIAKYSGTKQSAVTTSTKNYTKIQKLNKSSTLPLSAAAKRNAFERSRVESVNNGYAALRDHILEGEFEAQRNPSKSKKELCKIEIIRMAIDHIRSLEKVLECDDKSTLSSTSERSSFSVISGTTPTGSVMTSPSVQTSVPSSPRSNNLQLDGR